MTGTVLLVGSCANATLATRRAASAITRVHFIDVLSFRRTGEKLDTHTLPAITSLLPVSTRKTSRR
jgi:hypothetical protein